MVIKFYIIDNLSTGLKKNIPLKATFYKTDIGDKKRIKEILTNNNIDIVFHAAAFVDNAEVFKISKKIFYK